MMSFLLAFFLGDAVSAEPIALSGWASMSRTTVSPDEPVWLTVALENSGDRAGHVTTYDSPACFFGQHVLLTLSPDAKAKKTPHDCNPTPKRLKPGERVEVRIDLRRLFDLPAETPVGIAWNPGHGWRVDQWTSEVGPVRVREPITEAKLSIKGPGVELPEGSWTLLGHSHKRTMAGGPPSPLMVYYRWHPKGGEPEEKWLNLHMHETSQFQVGPYVFENMEHEYDGWMRLRIYP